MTPLRVDALGLKFLPLIAEAWLLEGELLRELGKVKEAESALLEAVVAADASQDDSARARAALQLTITVGLRSGRVEAGEHWGQLATGTLQRLGQPDELMGLLWSTMGALSESQGKSQEAMQRYERSLAARERALGPNSYLVGYTLNNLGVTATSLGEFKRAGEALERALTLQRADLGEGHPALSSPLTNLGTLRVREGDPDAGLALHEQAEALSRNALGPTHPQVAIALENEAEALLQLGRWAEAEERSGKALQIFDARFPEGQSAHVYILTARGEALIELGRVSEAVAALERGLKILELNPSPPELTARLHYFLARGLRQSGGDRARVSELATRAQQELPAHVTDLELPGKISTMLRSSEGADGGR